MFFRASEFGKGLCRNLTMSNPFSFAIEIEYGQPNEIERIIKTAFCDNM